IPMKLQTVIQAMNRIAPPQYACTWDTQIGLQIGNKNAEIKKALVALDITSALVNTAVKQKADLIVAHHETHMYTGLKFYPGLLDFLARLRLQKKLLGIVSNKHSYFIAKILAKLSCPVSFDIIVGADTLPEHKPSPRPVLHACAQLGLNQTEAVLLGDSIYDTQAGRQAGVFTIGCAWGFNGLEPFQAEPPDFVIHHISEIII
ncbi:haloacid dehalogenase superfamily hydrolase, partial [Candidatus Termititenax aidoneus]